MELSFHHKIPSPPPAPRWNSDTFDLPPPPPMLFYDRTKFTSVHFNFPPPFDSASTFPAAAAAGDWWPVISVEMPAEQDNNFHNPFAVLRESPTTLVEIVFTVLNGCVRCNRISLCTHGWTGWVVVWRWSSERRTCELTLTETVIDNGIPMKLPPSLFAELISRPGTFSGEINSSAYVPWDTRSTLH